MSSSIRHSFNTKEVDFSTLTNHELEIMEDFIEGNLTASALINSIIKVFKKVWVETDVNANAGKALDFMNFSEYKGKVINNPMYSLLVLRMVLKFSKEQNNEYVKEDVYKKIAIEWKKFLDWFNWRDDDGKGDEKEEEEPVEFVVSQTEFAQYLAFHEGHAGMPTWFMNDDVKVNEINTRYNELAKYYGY